jgi:tetratricopeptide (TPR) repeat protein
MRARWKGLGVAEGVNVGRYLEEGRKYIEQGDPVQASEKLYVDPFRIPYAIVLESKTISSYIAPGWSILMETIPMPKGTSPEVLVNMGVEMAKRGHHSLALTCYKKAIEMKPDLKEAYNNIGRLLAEVGRLDEALKYLEKALELDPKYTSALINKGIALVGLGKYTEALELFNKATSLDPDDEKAWYNKALLYYSLGRNVPCGLIPGVRFSPLRLGPSFLRRYGVQ